MSFARHGLAVFTWLFVPPPSPGTLSHSHSLVHTHPGLRACPARGAPPGGLRPRPAPRGAPMRRQPQVSRTARPPCARAGRGRETWGAPNPPPPRTPASACSSVSPQNGDLKKQLHERQPRIAALGDKQVSERPVYPSHPRPGRGRGRQVLWQNPKKCQRGRSLLRPPRWSGSGPQSYSPGPPFCKERAGRGAGVGGGAPAPGSGREGWTAPPRRGAGLHLELMTVFLGTRNPRAPIARATPGRNGAAGAAVRAWTLQGSWEAVSGPQANSFI